MAKIGTRHGPLAALVAATLVIAGSASGNDEPAFVMPPVLQFQAANGLSDEDVLRIVARENLMLTSGEAARIDAALSLAEAASADISAADETFPGPIAPRRYFSLDALLYFSPSSWSLWLNGVHVTPTTVPPDMRINAIAPDYVEIVWLPDPESPDDRRIFTLRSQQVYLTETDEVIDASKLALTELDVVSPPPIPVDNVEPETIPTDQRARPEELTLTQEQIDQLRDLENALKAQE
jgi:hypothetical protein